MQALEYRFDLPRYLAMRASRGKVRALSYGPYGALRLTDVPQPRRPGPDWLELEPLLSGICGTDVAIVTAKASPLLEPVASFPAVMGHEIVARVVRPPEPAGPFAPGDRVVVDPFLHCAVRGLEPCDNCRAGRTSACRNVTRGRFAPAMILGTCRDLPGGWAQRMVAHRSQVFKVPGGLPDESAVLAEPLSVALHGVLKAPPPPGAQVLIVGGGTIGLLTLAALRLLGLDCRVSIVVRHPAQQALALRLGADEAVRGGAGTALDLACSRTHAHLHRPTLGRPVLDWGFDLVFDCAGTPASLDDALRAARPGGAVILLGCAGVAPNLDWTLVWSRELQVLGSCGYGIESYRGDRLHTIALALQLLAAQPEYPVRDLVTHRFPLADYRKALRTAIEGKGAGAVKVVFQPA